jgi:uncharacterized protein DUF2442
MKAKSEKPGRSTLAAEVTNVSSHGFWLLLSDEEMFVPFDQFPWFKHASVDQVLNVELLHEGQLCWPDLDVDLAVESIHHPERFPLVAKPGPNKSLRRTRSRALAKRSRPAVRR